MYCKKCYNHLNVNLKYCPQCGTIVRKQNVEKDGGFEYYDWIIILRGSTN